MAFTARMGQRLLLAACMVLGLSGAALAGPYAPAAGQQGSTAVYKDDAAILGWASGYRDYAPGSNVDGQWQTPDKALGKAVGDAYDVVCLGRGGRITLTFSTVIGNGDGPDFAVFENSFSDTFLELAYVEVSTDGTTFARFPNDSQTASPVSAFGTLDPTDVDGLAGKYRQGYGTPFDLDDVAGEPEVQDGRVNLLQVKYVRLVDVLGDGSCVDTTGDIIYDPYPTSGSAGFDLDAVGVLNEGFENASPPDKPDLTAPAQASSVALPVTLKTGPFSDPDEPNGDSHSQTSWEVSTKVDFSETTTGVTSTQALRELKVFGALLAAPETYYWRARHLDSGSKASPWSESSFTTQAPVDTNDNGIPDVCDLAAGTVETVSGDMVLQGADGASQVGLTVTSGGAVSMEFAETLDPDDLPDLGGSNPEMMAMGVVSFRLEGVPVGGTATVTVALSEAAPSGYSYIKYDPAEGWKTFSAAVFSADRREITLTLRDGGDGDADGTANGVIVDPGGAGYVKVSTTTGGGGGTSGGSGGSGGAGSPPDTDGEAGFGGGGCFINSLTQMR